MVKIRISVAMAVAVGLSASGCIWKTSSETQSKNIPSMTVKDDSDGVLFGTLRANPPVSVNLQQEIKRQFLMAVEQSGVMKVIAGSNGELSLTEIGIARTEGTIFDINVGVGGSVSVRQQPILLPGGAGGNQPASSNQQQQGSNNQASTYNQNGLVQVGGGGISSCQSFSPASMGTNALQAMYHVEASNYNVSFAFQEKVTSAAEGEILRYQLRNPLMVEETFRLASSSSITFNAIKLLPKTVSTIVARFFDDISVALSGGVCFERKSELSTRMYYKAEKEGMTELMRDFSTDIIFPLCQNIVRKQGGDMTKCGFKLPQLSDPVSELAKRFETAVADVNACKKTELVEGFLPVYKLYFALPAGLETYAQGAKVFLYEKKSEGWQKWGWASAMGTETNDKCLLPKTSNKKCIVAKYGSQFFDGNCEGINKSALHIGAFNEDKPIIF